MVVGGSQQETLDPGFVLLGTRQQGVPNFLHSVISYIVKILQDIHYLMNNLVENKMVIGGSKQETLDLGFVLLGTRQQGVPIILKGLMLLDGFDPVYL
ncbi:unnamed protein product [Schistosoma margrebowiei]|uniref:Uncharacterized protein n=1 Tax=Schistosoma margrebowiei TaxID=48269 RepID=A0A183MSS2_9TREM|nr:unnamed protein product [Schistosoma margrebowiei]